MNHELSEADDRELERLAYGRADTPDRIALATAAGQELARRAELAAETRARMTVDLAIGDTASSEQDRSESAPYRPDDRHPRRMRTVGLVGVLSALLAIPTVGWALALPDPDPLAIFDEPETDEDREWASRLLQGYTANITQGPRVTPLGNDRFGIVYRASTVPDERSTEWDMYCIVIADLPEGSGGWGGGGTCVAPPVFDDVGIVVGMEGAIGITAGSDLFAWGPVGPPRLENDQDLRGSEFAPSVVDVIGVGAYGGSAVADPFSGIDEPDRLLMGPSAVYISPEAEESGADFSAYLIEGSDGEAEYCLRARHPDADTATNCAPLARVERSGLTVQLRIPDSVWTVGVNIDGSISSSVFPLAAG